VKNRKLIATMNKRGWTVTVTGKSHLRFQYCKTGDVIFHGGTPADRRSEKNLMARVRRIEAGVLEAPP